MGARPRPADQAQRVQSAFPDGQRGLADIMPGQPAQYREVRGPADATSRDGIVVDRC
jgi:hypothetical protein